MARELRVVVQRDSEGWYVATVPDVSGCHTQARTLDELMARLREAIGACGGLEPGDDEALTFVGIHRITVETSPG